MKSTAAESPAGGAAPQTFREEGEKKKKGKGGKKNHASLRERLRAALSPHPPRPLPRSSPRGSARSARGHIPAGSPPPHFKLVKHSFGRVRDGFCLFPPQRAALPLRGALGRNPAESHRDSARSGAGTVDAGPPRGAAAGRLCGGQRGAAPTNGCSARGRALPSCGVGERPKLPRAPPLLSSRCCCCCLLKGSSRVPRAPFPARFPLAPAGGGHFAALDAAPVPRALSLYN